MGSNYRLINREKHFSNNAIFHVAMDSANQRSTLPVSLSMALVLYTLEETLININNLGARLGQMFCPKNQNKLK
jgi:hypothetical protein